MATRYNEEVFNILRKFAVTDASKLVVGNTYYTNSPVGEECFVLRELITHAEQCRRDNLGADDVDDKELRWYTVEGSDDGFSLRDRNIGASYNPWLIFDNKDMLDLCKLCLPVTIYREDRYRY